jgi:hypothetical protein
LLAPFSSVESKLAPESVKREWRRSVENWTGFGLLEQMHHDLNSVDEGSAHSFYRAFCKGGGKWDTSLREQASMDLDGAIGRLASARRMANLVLALKACPGQRSTWEKSLKSVVFHAKSLDSALVEALACTDNVRREIVQSVTFTSHVKGVIEMVRLGYSIHTSSADALCELPFDGVLSAVERIEEHLIDLGCLTLAHDLRDATTSDISTCTDGDAVCALCWIPVKNQRTVLIGGITCLAASGNFFVNCLVGVKLHPFPQRKFR